MANIERIKSLQNTLRKAKERGDYLDLTTWGWGTTHCIAGWLTTDPLFLKAGGTTIEDNHGLAIPAFSDYEDYDAVSEYLDIDDDQANLLCNAALSKSYYGKNYKDVTFNDAIQKLQNIIDEARS